MGNSQITIETVKFRAAKATKIIKILDLSRNADVSNFFAKFQCFCKKITKIMFFPKKTLINTKYECQDKEKVELENSM